MPLKPGADSILIFWQLCDFATGAFAALEEYLFF